MATAVMSPETRTTQSCVQLGFRLGAAVLGLEIADDAALQVIQDAYAPLLCENTGARAHASLRRLSDGRLHVRYGRNTLRSAGVADTVPLRAAYHAAREIFARFACEPANSIAVYGALFAVKHGAVLLLGPTAIGKTLLALHAAHRGARFLGDETAVIALSSGDVFAMPRRPTLRESALPLLHSAELRESIVASPRAFPTERGRFWYALDAKALGGIEPSERSYPLRAVFVLRERAETPAIRQIDATEGLKFLGQRAYVRPTSLAQLSAMRRATRHAKFFEMSLGDPESSSQALLREVESCA